MMEDEVWEQMTNGWEKFLSTTDILALPFYTGFKSLRDISDCCAEKQIAAFKTRPDKNGKWRIPIESFAIYVDTHDDVATSFVRAWKKYADNLKAHDVQRYKIMNSIYLALERLEGYTSERISVTELSIVFSMPRNQIETIFGVSASKLTVAAHDIGLYLRHHPDLVESMWDRFKSLYDDPLPASRYQAASILHICMIYEYHYRTYLHQLAKVTRQSSCAEKSPEN